nr:arginine kinase-like protein [Pomacea canaliculata]
MCTQIPMNELLFLLGQRFLSLSLYSDSLLPHVDHSYINVLTPVRTHTHVAPVHACAEWRQHYSSRNKRKHATSLCPC